MMNYLSSPLPKKIFKGDQNLLWDGFITDFALTQLLSKQYPGSQFIPFIHDEKVGAADVNMVYCLRDQSTPYLLSEDYADSAGDACYINIDGSYGLFYLPVVEEDRLKEFGISIRAKSKQFLKMKSRIGDSFIRECAETGLVLDFSETPPEMIGSLLHQDVLDCYFTVHPFQQLFFLFSKSHGRIGIVPSDDQNILLSSLDCDEPNFQHTLKDFMQRTFYESAVRYADPSHLASVQQRIQQLELFLEKQGAWTGSYTNWQLLIVRFMEQSMLSRSLLPYTKSSEIFQTPSSFDIEHSTMQILLDQPEVFMECYNEALNEARLSIQRMVVKDSMLNIPYYINRLYDGKHYSRTALYMHIQTKKLYFREKGRWLEFSASSDHGFITGKAIPFLNELRSLDKTIALPESGSKYTPACKAMIRLLREKGIEVPVSPIIRIGLNFLDHLSLKKDYQLTLPGIFHPFFGQTISTEQFSQTWREICRHIESILEDSKWYEEDQQIRLAEKWFSEENSKALSYMDPPMKNLLYKTIQSYHVARERKQASASKSAISSFRTEKWKLNLLVDYYKQRLVQVMDGLHYLNNRPYSLSIWILFGPEFFWELLPYVTFRQETE